LSRDEGPSRSPALQARSGCGPHRWIGLLAAEVLVRRTSQPARSVLITGARLRPDRLAARASTPRAGGWAEGDPPGTSGQRGSDVLIGRRGRRLPMMGGGTAASPLPCPFDRLVLLTRLPALRCATATTSCCRNLLRRSLPSAWTYASSSGGGAPFAGSSGPSRGEVRKMRRRAHPANEDPIAVWIRKERPLHCHHEKTIVIDDRVAFVRRESTSPRNPADRYDSSEHPCAAPALGLARPPAAKIEGPVVGDVAEHFRMPLAPRSPGGGSPR